MYYVYELQDPETLIPFYVGKGKNKRAYYHIKRNKEGFFTENRYKDNVIRQILSSGKDPIIEYKSYFEEEELAYLYEEQLIKTYGRRLFEENGLLTNLCESNRPPHHNYSDERKEKYRDMMLGNTINTGRKQSEEEKLKRSESLIKSYQTGKRIVSDKMREVTRLTHTGKIVSDETRKKQSKIAKNRPPRSRESIEKGLETKKEREYLPPNRKEISIQGIIYSSIREASKIFGISEYKIKLLDDNK